MLRNVETMNYAAIEIEVNKLGVKVTGQVDRCPQIYRHTGALLYAYVVHVYFSNNASYVFCEFNGCT